MKLTKHWRLEVAWTGPQDYVFTAWLCDWGWYRELRMCFLRICGLFVQVYDNRVVLDRLEKQIYESLDAVRELTTFLRNEPLEVPHG